MKKKTGTAVAVAKGGAVIKADSSSLLQALTAAASNPKTDIEKMERLFKMHQEMVKTQAEAAFNAALARAQKRIEPVVRNKKNTHTNSTYADLAAVIEIITPIYTDEGLSLSFNTVAMSEPKGWVKTIGILSHEGGHTRPYELALPPDDVGPQGKANKTGVQAAVSTLSYAKRVLACAIFNVATIDNDGNSEKKNGKEPVPDKLFLGKLELAAVKGTLALQAVWEGGSIAQRKSCEKVWSEGRLKRIAMEAGE